MVEWTKSDPGACALAAAPGPVPPLDCGASLVGVAQLVELRIVVPAVGGSSPLAHP